MKHALIEAATDAELRAATEAADWLLDAIATATQDRRFLRGEAEYDWIAGEAILTNGTVACIRSMAALALNGVCNGDGIPDVLEGDR